MRIRLVRHLRRAVPVAAGLVALTSAVLALLLSLLRGAWSSAERAAGRWVLPPSAQVPEPAPPVVRGRTVRGVREIAVCAAVVLVAGMGAASTSATAPAAPAVTAAVEQPVGARPQPRPAVPDAAVPGTAPPEARTLPPELRAPTPPPAPPAAPAEPTETVAAEPEERWLPTGTGMWIHDWVRTEGGNPDAVVAKAKAGGMTHLYVQTGSTKKGFIGEEVLSALLPATKGLGMDVIAWDFPKLLDPEADAQRMVDAATWRRPGVPRVAAVAPDVETAAEGTHISADAAARYYAALRAGLPADVAILATVPWPSEKRIGSYPYAETAVHADAFVPMAYWYNRSPHLVTQTSMQWLAQFGKPVMPVGQGYDGRLDAPYLPPDPDPAGSVQQFVDAARAGGARSISLWSWQTTDVPQWQVLAGSGWLEWPSRS